MKKAAALTLAGLMAVSSANASMSRWGGFGESAKFVADVQDMWTLPSVVASNADTTYFEFGKINTTVPTVATSTGWSGYAVAANAWGGTNMTLGPGVLGIWYNRPFTKGGSLNTGTITSGALTSSFAIPMAGIIGPVAATFNTPQNQIDLVYGFAAGGATVGVGLTLANNSQKTEVQSNAGTDVTSQNSGDFGISLGAGFKEVGPMKTLDAGLQFDMASAQNSAKDAANTYDDKITFALTEINFRVSADLGKDNTGNIVDLIVISQGATVKSEPKTAAAAPAYTEAKLSYMDVNLGWAMSKSSDKGMGLGGFILDWNTTSRDQMHNLGALINDKADISVLGIKGVSGGEVKAKEWLSLRMALSGTLYYSSSTTIDQGTAGTTNKTTVSTSVPATPAAITVGTSIHVGELVIDGVANQDMFFSGPYLVSGVPAGLSTQVSATWGWGGSKE